MRRTSFTLLLLLLPTVANAELTIEECRSLQKELSPDANQLWRKIPWKIELLKAQRLAATQNKPIFIWAMDGHPLGCT